MNNELPWMKIARSYLGIKEIKGQKTNPEIQKMLSSMGKYSKEDKAWWKDDETPWCGLFVGFCLGEGGRFVPKNWYRALAYKDAGMRKLAKPCYGAIAVFSRTGGGHVGFVVGKSKTGKVLILGGNQNDAVSIKAFDMQAGEYFWASHWISAEALRGSPRPDRYDLPVFDNAQAAEKLV